MAEGHDPVEGAGGGKGAPLSKKRKQEVAAGAVAAGLLVFLYLRSRSSSSTSSTTAAGALPASSLNGTGAPDMTAIDQQLAGIQTELAALQGGFGAGGGGTSSSTSAGGTTPGINEGLPPDITGTIPPASNPSSYTPPSVPLTGQAAAAALNAGVPTDQQVSVGPGDTLAYNPSTGYSGTATSPGGTETVTVSGGGISNPSDTSWATTPWQQAYAQGLASGLSPSQASQQASSQVPGS